ncbi:hypothetical protein GVN20_17745 [Runella sp. CRIBMP]|uniref:toxin-antitoxin system TumE family protein n=1 Tax=Runella sp. CRIBMP TaxID=2683261 RepID=UPI0014129C7C|nr:DUF6516 family protein [Runella sp. CRIBMP]NBB21213.1 hypothetical protein [Runella sp. CRIBMP]
MSAVLTVEKAVHDIRWNNTAHHPYIDTFPFHCHAGSETNVLPSEPMTIEKVLTYIASQLSEG